MPKPKYKSTLLRALARFRFLCGFGEHRAAELPCYESVTITGAEARKLCAYIEYLEGIQCAVAELGASDSENPVAQLVAEMGIAAASIPRRMKVLSSEFKLEVSMLRKAFYEAAKEVESMNATFDLVWKAHMRAAARWQEDTGRELTWPDTSDLCVWLLKKLDEAEAREVVR